MRAIHVVAGLRSDEGGPVETLPEIWKHLEMLGVEVDAYTTDHSGSLDDVRRRMGEKARLHSTGVVFPRVIRHSPQLLRALRQGMKKADLCHNHGCWLYPNWAAAWAAREAGKPLILSPLGHLDEWSLSHHGFGKKIIRALVEERLWRGATAWVAKSEMEADQLRKLGMRQTIEIIPNGIHPSDGTESPGESLFLDRFPVLKGRRILLFLSRIHPKKGVMELLKNWGGICGEHPEWQLVIAGEGAEYLDEVRKRLESSSFGARVTFTGGLKGDLRQSAYAAAELFILPSHSENFGQVILESLAAGLPVIATRGCPWRKIQEKGCGWWIPLEDASLQSTLREGMGLAREDLKAMGRKGREWVNREFDWKNLMIRMKELYLT